MRIPLHTPDSIYSQRHLPSWLALACAAGEVNGFAFSNAEQFVSHVTGTATRIGLEWHNVGLAFEYTVVVLSYLAGTILSVVWIQARAYRGQRPQWATPLIFVALILLVTGAAGHFGIFGEFGDRTAADPPPAVLLSFLGFSMGLQNAAVASTTGLAVRTTHLTGPVTDLGIHLGASVFARGEGLKSALRGAELRGGKVLAIVAGRGTGLRSAGVMCVHRYEVASVNG